MAYTVTMTFTRPDESTELPTLQAINSSHKTSADTVMSENGVAKTYDIDGLVTRVIYTAADKATYDNAKSLADDLSDESTVRTTYKSQCEAANITCSVVDSEGTTITSF